MASQITSLTIAYSTVYSDADQRKHHSSASLAFVRGIHQWPVNSSHKWLVYRENFSIWWRHHVWVVASGQISDKTTLALGIMSRYFAHILICLMRRLMDIETRTSPLLCPFPFGSLIVDIVHFRRGRGSSCDFVNKQTFIAPFFKLKMWCQGECLF